MTLYDLGQAAVLLWQSGEKRAADATISYGLKGKLQLSHSGWLLLTVPNDIGIGAFKALNAPGAEMPFSSTLGRYNAHISVMRPEEVQQIGADNINERGKELSFTLGPVREVEPAGWAEMDRCWFIECRSPDLEKLRKSYGLSSLPKGGDYQFHITFAVRRRKVLRPGDVVKRMSRGSLIHRPIEFMKVSANKQITYPTKVTKNVTVTDEVCPHCNEVIGEKAMYVDEEGYEYHRPCYDAGPIGRLFTAKQMQDIGHPQAAKEKKAAELEAVNSNQANYWKSPSNKDGRKCPGCHELFKECEPLEGVSMCEVCERYGPRRTKEAAMRGVEIRESAIDGKGLFATRDFEAGDIVVPRAMVKLQGDNGLTNYEQSDESRFTNHSNNPTIFIRKNKDDGSVDFVAAGAVAKGTELTGDYNACNSILGPGFYFTHRGKPYTGESTSGRAESDDGYLHIAADQPDVDAALLAMWDTAYDPIRGTRQSGDGDRPRSIGDSSAGASAPWQDGSGTDRVGSLHDAPSTVSKMAIDSGRAQGGSLDSQQKNAADLLSRLCNLPAPVAEDIGARVLQRDARSSTQYSTTDPVPSWSKSGSIRYGAADSSHGHDYGIRGQLTSSFSGVLNGFTQNEKAAAIAGITLAQQIAVARRKTKPPASDLQAEAGNYPKGKVVLHGLTVAIENGKGSTRSGTDPNGKTWSIKMKYDYGYIHRTTGKDGDPIDVFIGPDPDVEAVWIVNQYINGKFDEHKCMMGFKGQEAAREGYLANYEDGWQGLESIVGLTMEQFKDWIKNGDQKKPVKPYAVKKADNWGRQLDDLLLRRDPAGISNQQWDVAMRATPVQYDLNTSPLANIVSHVGKIRSHGMQQVSQQGQHDRLLNAADPARAVRQLQAALTGGANHGQAPGRRIANKVT